MTNDPNHPPPDGDAGPQPMSRRSALQLGALSGAGLVAGCSPSPVPLRTNPEGLPIRPLGTTGLDIPILMFGGVDLLPTSLILLRQARSLGITAWETGEEYGKGNSELAIGRYLSAFPEDRPHLTLMTKSTALDPMGLTRSLEGSLARMGTDHVEIYLLHGIPGPWVLTEEVRAWAEQAKAAGKVRTFGFAAHKRVSESLAAAATLGWVDVALAACNYRSLLDPATADALAACRAAGVGLIAMKTQGLKSVPNDPVHDAEVHARFQERGYTLPQARMQAVWDDPSVASICSKMPNTRILNENLSAARHGVPLSPAERGTLDEHAEGTKGAWCDGCSRCEEASGLPVPEVLRALMYDHGYGEPDRARALVQDVIPGAWPPPEQVAVAEAACPSGVRIAAALADARARYRS